MSEWMSVKQVASMHDVNESTVVRWIQAGVLPAYRLGGAKGRYRVRREDARALLHPVEPGALSAAEARDLADLEEAIRQLREMGYRVD